MLAVVLTGAAAFVPATAAARSCGEAKGAGNGTVVTQVTTSSGSCATAKVTARAFARTRVAPPGYTCKERFTRSTRASVSCRRSGRTITFKVAWNGAMPLPPAAALPG